VRRIVAPSPGLASRNRQVALALNCLEKQMSELERKALLTDWKAATIYVLDNPNAEHPKHTAIGKVKNSVWTWHEKDIADNMPMVNLENLKADLSSMSE
jgi:hypothetical protein